VAKEASIEEIAGGRRTDVRRVANLLKSHNYSFEKIASEVRRDHCCAVSRCSRTPSFVIRVPDENLKHREYSIYLCERHFVKLEEEFENQNVSK